MKVQVHPESERWVSSLTLERDTGTGTGSRIPMESTRADLLTHFSSSGALFESRTSTLTHKRICTCPNIPPGRLSSSGTLRSSTDSPRSKALPTLGNTGQALPYDINTLGVANEALTINVVLPLLLHLTLGRCLLPMHPNGATRQTMYTPSEYSAFENKRKLPLTSLFFPPSLPFYHDSPQLSP